MDKVLCVFAQVGEAKALIERTRAQPVPEKTANIWTEGEVCSLYRFEEGWITICGVGVHAAQMAVAKYGHLSQEVWNAGFAGSLRGLLPIGDLMPISTIGKYIPLDISELDSHSQENIAFNLPHFSLSEGEGKLISSDFPIHNAFHRERLGKQWDLVDMEGYGIAYAARDLRKKCRMWKIVSDFASPGGLELIRKHGAELSEKIADTLLFYLSKI